MINARKYGIRLWKILEKIWAGYFHETLKISRLFKIGRLQYPVKIISR
jgi:hypothetical protein